MNKVWGIGEKLYFLDINDNIVEYIVEDFGVYMTEDGNHTVGLTLSTENRSLNAAYWIVEQLYKSGHIWRDGGEEMAKFLRKKELEISKSSLTKPNQKV